MSAPSRLTFRCVAGLAALTALAVVQPAQATPYVGTFRGMTFATSVTGSDHLRYDIEVTATQDVLTAVGSEQALYVDIRRCSPRSCVAVLHGRKELSAGEVTISPDLTSGQLRTTLDGVALRVDAFSVYIEATSLTVNTPGAGVYSLESSRGGPNVRADLFQPNVGPVGFGRRSCGDLTVELFSFYSVDQVGDDQREAPRVPVRLPAALKAPTACA